MSATMEATRCSCGRFAKPDHGHCEHDPVPRAVRDGIPLAPFREAYERSGMHVRDVARKAGMDWSYTRRLLTGCEYYSRKRGKRYGPYVFQATTYETAVKLAQAMDLDPFEVGI